MIRFISCLILFQVLFCHPLKAEETKVRPNEGNDAHASNADGSQQSTLTSSPVISAPDNALMGAPPFLVEPRVKMQSLPIRKPDPYNSAGEIPITEIPLTQSLLPYMKYLQEQILRQWNPPKGYEEKRVVLNFELRKDGSISNIRLHRSSGVTIVDEATLNAVKGASPFKPAPSELGDSSEIQFTFDANLAKGIEHGGN